MSSNAREAGGWAPGEGRVLATLVVVQLVAVVDFTILLPLGPDLIAPLSIAPSHLPLLVAAGTLSAALAGLTGGCWRQRLSRRSAMTALLLALAAAGLLASSAAQWPTLLLARLVSGAAAGQAMALSLAALSDHIAEERRGRAVGTLMAANGFAAIGGVPLGLWLAARFGWQAPFWMIAGAAACAAALTARSLPATSPQAPAAEPSGPPAAGRPTSQTFVLTFVVTAASFLLNPNLSTFIQKNLAYPREHLAGLYAVAGLAALVASQVSGRAVDRVGSFWVGLVAVLVTSVVVLALLVVDAGVPVGLAFVLLLCGLQSRNVSTRALATRVPLPEDRARFMSRLSGAQHLGAATGALGSAMLLGTHADGRLDGMPRLALLSLTLSLASLPLLAAVQREVDRARSGAQAAPAQP